MAGITRYGAYVPRYRLTQDAVCQVWDKKGAKSEKSVANYDEDSITMAVDASSDCLGALARETVQALYFASSTAPYREKQCASVTAAAADLKAGVTMDFANSLRAGTNALKAALDAVGSGSLKNVLVTAADCRLGYPQSAQEQSFGDAAAAVLVGNEGVIAEVEGSFSVSDDITDVWRKDQDRYVQTWEDRWVIAYGYDRNVRAAVAGLLKQLGAKPTDFAKVALCGPDARSHEAAAKAMGFDKAQLQDPLLSNVGNTGVAHPLLLLSAALEGARPGDRLLLVSYGDGADAFALKVTAQAAEYRKGLGIAGNLAFRRALTSYGKYMTFRNLVEQPEEYVRLHPSATVMWRTRDWALRGHGSRCKKCGTVAFPIQRVCYTCRSKDDYEQVRLMDKKGKVFTYSVDTLAGTPDPPVVQTIVESDEGKARIYCIMADGDPSEVKIGSPVEFTLRRFHEQGGFINYFWKCRPARA